MVRLLIPLFGLALTCLTIVPHGCHAQPFEMDASLALEQSCGGSYAGTYLAGDVTSPDGYLLMACESDLRRVNLHTFVADLRFAYASGGLHDIKWAEPVSGWSFTGWGNTGPYAILGGVTSNGADAAVWQISADMPYHTLLNRTLWPESSVQTRISSLLTCQDSDAVYVTVEGQETRLMALNRTTLEPLMQPVTLPGPVTASALSNTAAGTNGVSCGGLPLYYAVTPVGAAVSVLLEVSLYNPSSGTVSVNVHKAFYNLDSYTFRHLVADASGMGVVMVSGSVRSYLRWVYSSQQFQVTPSKVNSATYDWLNAPVVLGDYDDAFPSPQVQAQAQAQARAPARDAVGAAGQSAAGAQRDPRAILLANQAADGGEALRLAFPSLSQAEANTGTLASFWLWGSIYGPYWYMTANSGSTLGEYPLARFTKGNNTNTAGKAP